MTGCTKVSPGCKHCYAERMAGRLHAMGAAAYRNGFELTLQPQKLDLPLRWRRPQTIFVNSMSDLFHEDVPTDYVRRVFDVMRRASWHRFQVLTKRAERLAELDAELVWAPNIWMGVSVESAAYAWRIDCLRRTRARVRFLSLEPLLGPLEGLHLSGIHWVIVGGESGPGARPMEAPWVRSVRDQCLRAGVPFFFKQWGGVNKKRAGRVLDGRTWDEMPDVRGLDRESGSPVDRGDDAGFDGRRERDELAAAMNPAVLVAEHPAARAHVDEWRRLRQRRTRHKVDAPVWRKRAVRVRNPRPPMTSRASSRSRRRLSAPWTRTLPPPCACLRSLSSRTSSSSSLPSAGTSTWWTSARRCPDHDARSWRRAVAEVSPARSGLVVVGSPLEPASTRRATSRSSTRTMCASRRAATTMRLGLRGSGIRGCQMGRRSETARSQP